MKNFGYIIGGCAIILFSCTAGVLGGFFSASVTRNSGISDILNNTISDVRVVQEESAVIDAANKASPSVVSIVVSRNVSDYYDNPFYRYFGLDESERNELRQVGAGSGFVIDEEGLIITNRHVVSDENASYTVVFNDGTRAEAIVLARDTILDIAFIRVSGVDVTPLSLGSSSELKVGQSVIAIGNALGEFSNTVSTGIISGLSRDIVASDSLGANSEELDNLIQTDASINPGNSGGPLLDIEGNVIGVNVAVADAENIGFAIPIDTVKDLISRLNAEGEIERPALGVRYALITEEIKEENNLSVDYGALVVRGNRVTDLAVVPGSAADKAGIKENDIILEINGTRVDQTNPLQSLIQQYKVGEEISVKILSGGQEKDLQVTLQKST